MRNLSFYYHQNKPFLFAKGLVLGGYCNGSDAGMGKIAVKNNNENSDIVIYPNPTNTEFSIKSSLKIKQVIIINSLGQMLLETKEKNVSISHFAKGIYIVHIVLENEEVQTKKLIIN